MVNEATLHPERIALVRPALASVYAQDELGLVPSQGD